MLRFWFERGYISSGPATVKNNTARVVSLVLCGVNWCISQHWRTLRYKPHVGRAKALLMLATRGGGSMPEAESASLLPEAACAVLRARRQPDCPACIGLAPAMLKSAI